MRTRLMTLIAAAFGGALASSPALADWYGTAVVAWVPKTGCVGVRVGDSMSMRYREPFIANRANFTGLVFYTPWGAQAYKITGHLGTAWKAAEATGIGWDGFVWKGARAKMVNKSPSNVLSNTTFVTMTVDVEKWWGQAGCTVSLSGSVIRTTN
jgi:hypothetical protein